MVALIVLEDLRGRKEEYWGLEVDFEFLQKWLWDERMVWDGKKESVVISKRCCAVHVRPPLGWRLSLQSFSGLAGPLRKLVFKVETPNHK